MRNKPSTYAFSSSSSSTERTGKPFSKASRRRCKMSASILYFLSPVFCIFFALSRYFVTLSRSAKINSRLMISISLTGSTDCSTCVILLSSKQRTTCTIASTSRIWLKNLLPRPSPFEAPLTRPAMSTNFKKV